MACKEVPDCGLSRSVLFHNHGCIYFLTSHPSNIESEALIWRADDEC